MIIKKIVYELPFEFYTIILAVTILYVIWMAIQIISTSRRVRHLQYELYGIEDSIRLHQGCHIENLPLISEIFEASSRKLSYAYDKMIQISIDFHQKRWIPNPGDFINVDSVMEKNIAKRIKGYGFLYFSLLGLFLSVSTIVTGMVLFETEAQISACLILSLLPLFFCILFTVLFFIEKKQNAEIVSSSINSLVQTLSRKLPVFNDYNGLALLINQFLDYDRNMTKAVDRLTEQIDHFVVEGLTTAVTTSIEKTLMESVAPSIERATDAIVTLSTDVVEKENAGMKELALTFSTALSNELSYQFEPMIKEITEVANTLSNSKNYMDIATKTLDTYKQNAIELQTLTSRTLVDYESAKESFSKDIHDISDSFVQFSQASKEYNQRSDLNQQQFESATAALKTSMEEEAKTLRLLLDGIFVEARNTEVQAAQSQKMNEKYLETMNKQIDAFSQELTARNKEFTLEYATRNKELFEGLSSTISEFVRMQSSQIKDQNDKVGAHSLEILQSMEKASQDIRTSSSQIRQAFDELEAARVREEEIAKTRKTGLFGRKG